MPITVASSTNKSLILTKQYLATGEKTSEANVKTFNLKTVDPQTPEELERIFRSLTPNQAIIAGVHVDNKKQTNHRTKDNFTLQSPWLPFDRDYQTPKDQGRQYIDILSSIDPQFSQVSYLLKNSASNTIKDGKPVNPTRQKLWVRFHPSNTTEEIIEYSKRLYYIAIARGYHHYFISQSESAYPIPLHRTVFDTSAFQTQALSFEALPVIDPASGIKHNTKYQTHTGIIDYIDATSLTLSSLDEELYQQAILDANEALKSQITDRLMLLKSTHPEQNWDSIDRGILTADTILITDDNNTMSVQEIIDAMIDDNTEVLEHFASLSYRDPMDPEYGPGKAKLYINDSLDIKLHSFAHGPHYFSILPPIEYLSLVMDKRGYITSYNARDKNERKLLESASFITQNASKFYADSPHTIEIAVGKLSRIINKPTLRSILSSQVKTPSSLDTEKRKESKSHPLSAYSFLCEGAGKLIKYDPIEGLTGFTIKGAEEYLRNESEYMTGKELLDEYMDDPDREDVNGMGLYPAGTTGKKNMWQGFNVSTIPQTDLDQLAVTQANIAPFIEFLNILTAGDEGGTNYLMEWLADLIQNPLRNSDIRSAIVLESPEKGTGKSTFSDFVSSFFNPVNTLTTSKLSHIIGRFNIRLMPVVFINIDEFVNDTGMSRMDIVNMLKGMISNPTMQVEPKGIDSKTVPNRLHLLITTNRPFTYIESDDRRFSVFNVSNSHQNNKEYFSTLREWWYHQSGRDMVFTYLSNLNYSLQKITFPYEGGDTLKARIERLWNVDAWIYWLITHHSDMTINSLDLHKSYSDFMQEESPEIANRYMLSPIKLTKALRRDYEGRGLEYVNRVYEFDMPFMRDTFANVKLNSTNMDWSDKLEGEAAADDIESSNPSL